MMVLSVVAVTASFAGAAAAADDGPDETLDADSLSGQDVWIGQEVEITNLTSPADLMQDDEVVENLRVDENGNATIDTSDLSEGRYYIEEGQDDTATGSFWVNEHEIETEFTESSTNQDTVDLEYEDVSDEPRTDDVNVTVSGELDGEALSDSDLEEIFGGTTVEDEDKVEITIPSDTNVAEADFSDQDVGSYNFTVEVADTTAEDTASVDVTDTDASVTFDDTSYEENVGDEVEMTLDLQNTEQAGVDLIYDGEVLGQVDVTDATDDDEVTLVLNTYDKTVSLAEDDESGATVVPDFSEIEGDEPLPAIDYELEAFPSTDRDGETDASLLILNERSTDDVTTHVAPSSVSPSDDLDNILEDATQRDYVAQGDYLITQVEASGIYGYLDDGNLEDHGLQLHYEQSESGPFDSPEAFNLSDVDSDNYVIKEDAQNDTFYVIFDVNDIQTANMGTDEDEDMTSQSWNVEFSVNEDNDYIENEDDVESVDQDFDVEEPSVEIEGDFDDDDRLQVSNSAESEVTAETNIAPGTEGEFAVRFQTEVEYADAVVDADGMIANAFDFSDREAGEEIRYVRVNADGASDEVEGTVVQADEQPAEPEPEFTVDTEAPSEVTVNESAELGVTLANDGDANGTTNLTVTVGDETVDDTTKEIAAGEETSFSYDIPTDEAGDVSWEVTVDDDSASGTVTVAEEGDGEDGTDGEDGEDGTDGEDGEDGTDGEDGEDGTDSEDGGDGSDGDAEGQPGFGVAVALVAMLAAAMLALRRQN